jgi:cytochrome c oxidase subunit 2
MMVLNNFASAALGLAGPATGWLPPQASSAAEEVDFVFAVIFWICAFFFFVTMVILLRFVWAYRDRPGAQPKDTPNHSTKLEVFWTTVPTVLIVIIFGLSTNAYLELMEPPDDVELEEIKVTARKWSWTFDYEDGSSSSELHVLVNQPVLLTMGAEDVLHSFYVPAFRLKQDIVPGRYVKSWFKPTVPGTYPLYCAEYCGTNHSRMVTQVVVHEDRAAYEAGRNLAKKLNAMSLLDVGLWVHEKKGCKACHTLDGKKTSGPTFKGLWGKEESLTTGLAVVDENYIRESIVEPKKKIVAGYEPLMPPTPMTEREILGMIELIKSLEDKSK